MVSSLEIAFWLCVGCVVYTYVAYPIGMWALARLFGRPVRPDGAPPRSVSVVVAAYNEEARIGRVDEVAQYMGFIVVLFGTHLDARDNLDAQAFAGMDRLVQADNGVMIG